MRYSHDVKSLLRGCSALKVCGKSVVYLLLFLSLHLKTGRVTGGKDVWCVVPGGYLTARLVS